MNLLHIDSSILGKASISRQLTSQFVSTWQQKNPSTRIEYLDLSTDAPNHLSADSIGFRIPPGDVRLSEVQIRENQISEKLVTQFLAAAVLVIGAPFYNLTIPSQLKAWIDRIAQVGRTFRYTPSGPEGLAGGKKVIIISTRGGKYATSEAGRAMEHQESYLLAIFSFLGISDVHFIRAEGLAMGDESRQAALDAAQSALAGFSYSL